MTAVVSASLASAGVPSGRDFSLVLGGPMFQLLRRSRMADDKLGLLHRRILLVVLITWAPIVVLSALQGGLIGPGRELPFLQDIGFQLRFLVVAPLLVAAELIVHRRMQPIIDQFRARSLVPPPAVARFADALIRAARLRNSVVAELILLAIVYAAGGLFTLHRYVALGGDAWFTSPRQGAGLSLAGLWLVLVSLPLLQFLLLRWYFRLLIWAQFLWRVSRLDLDLNATHPDKSAGLGFLADSLVAFVPISIAHGVLVAGTLADRIFYGGAKLTDFQVDVLGGTAFLVLIFAGPLMVFAPRLAHVKRLGLREYGALGQDYVRGFREKWLAGGAPPDEPLIGSGDIQSLADLGNSFASAEQMRIAPIRPSSLLLFVAAFLLPITPLLLTMMSAEKLLERMVGVVF